MTPSIMTPDMYPLPAMKTEPTPPVTVAIIGTGDGGTPLTSGVTAVTPGHQPNLIVTLVTPLVAILVRFVNQFLTTLVGLVGAGMTPAGGRILHADDFVHLVLTCASLSIAGAGFALIKDCVTIFSKLEQKYPVGTGSV